jgi:hypothetical protein
MISRGYVEAGERAWAREEPAWGIWQVPESEVQVFPENSSARMPRDRDCYQMPACRHTSLQGFAAIGNCKVVTVIREAGEFEFRALFWV